MAVDSNIGSLPAAASIEDDSLLVAEQQGEAKHFTGKQLKDYAKQGVDALVAAAQKAADDAAQAARDAKAAADSVQDVSDDAEAAIAAARAATQAMLAADNARLAAETAARTAAADAASKAAQSVENKLAGYVTDAENAKDAAQSAAGTAATDAANAVNSQLAQHVADAQAAQKAAEDARDQAQAIAGGDFLERPVYDPQGKKTDIFAYAIPAPKVSGNGSNLLNIENAPPDCIKGVVFYGKTTQNGTPSMTAPVALESPAGTGACYMRVNGTLYQMTAPGAFGVKVASGGNFTDSSGQQWIADEVDFTRGVFVQRIQKVVLNGTEEWQGPTTDPTPCFRFFLPKRALAVTADHFLYSHWKSKPYPYVANNVPGYAGLESQRLYVYTPCGDFATVDEFKAWLAANPVTMVYAIETPVETKLTPAQMNIFKAITNDPGTVTVSTTIPAVLEVSGLASANQVERAVGKHQMSVRIESPGWYRVGRFANNLHTSGFRMYIGGDFGSAGARPFVVDGFNAYNSGVVFSALRTGFAPFQVTKVRACRLDINSYAIDIYYALSTGNTVKVMVEPMLGTLVADNLAAVAENENPVLSVFELTQNGSYRLVGDDVPAEDVVLYNGMTVEDAFVGIDLLLDQINGEVL